MGWRTTGMEFRVKEGALPVPWLSRDSTGEEKNTCRGSFIIHGFFLGEIVAKIMKVISWKPHILIYIYAIYVVGFQGSVAIIYLLFMVRWFDRVFCIDF